MPTKKPILANPPPPEAAWYLEALLKRIEQSKGGRVVIMAPRHSTRWPVLEVDAKDWPAKEVKRDR